MGSAEARPGSEAQLAEVASRFGTPIYVMDAAALRRAAGAVERAFPSPWVLSYSLKANDLPAVTAVLVERGWGANVVSFGEWQLARDAGVGASRTTVEGIGKTDADLEAVVQAAAEGQGVRWLSVESGAELARLVELLAIRPGRLSQPIDVLLRLNPQVRPETSADFAVGLPSSKFGMDTDEVREVVAATKHPDIRIRGIHVHVGSDLRDVVAWAVAGRRAVELLAEVRPSCPDADTVDFGGGFPTAEDAPTPKDFHDALVFELDAAGLRLPPVCAIEPGRSLVGSAGTLVAAVLHARSRPPYPQQVVLDAGMTELIRPALYGSHHPISVVSRATDATNGVRPDLVSTAVEGPICESTDSFGLHQLPRLSRGDLVALGEAGAYCASFTSRYNGRPHPREVMFWEDGSCSLAERHPLIALPAPPTATSHPTQRGSQPHPSRVDSTVSADGVERAVIAPSERNPA
jgi:diaminopimelate decarboxylase